ncbi:hypothetical protein KP509_01G053000 [Ceratopteris richardii]|uniref:Uncharacterized protein n=1 Tax=Ceratopteris richardii TaxID=49495 RepID=A0A8T2VGB9_CERRI|nr:hypothetical protein KP509_01G053000 [Ceratopteris richardii]
MYGVKFVSQIWLDIMGVLDDRFKRRLASLALLSYQRCVFNKPLLCVNFFSLVLLLAGVQNFAYGVIHGNGKDKYYSISSFSYLERDYLERTDSDSLREILPAQETITSPSRSCISDTLPQSSARRRLKLLKKPVVLLISADGFRFGYGWKVPMPNLERLRSSGCECIPDDPHIDAAITFVDQMLGKVLDGLDERGIFEDVSIIFVSDHGMVGTCDTKSLYFEDFRPWLNISAEWADTLTPIFSLWPPDELDVVEVYQRLATALSSGMVENAEFLEVYLKEDLPSRLLYSSSERVQPIIGIVAEGYTLELNRTVNKKCGGAHGYDNALLSMRATFIAHGPQFGRGQKLPNFNNVEIYNLIASILGIEGAPNNGSSSFAETILLPEVSTISFIRD